MSAKTLFDKLNEANIVGAEGKTFFRLQNLQTIVRDSSIVGNVIQEWLKSFMKKHRIFYRVKKNTQEFPDFLMHKNNNMLDLLEVKCFKKNPNFDIANFQAYARSLIKYPYRLDSDYLIFEYMEKNDGIIIKNIWLKKVWELCSTSERSPLKIQWKQGIPVNIRPCTWYSKNPRFSPFKTRVEFVNSIKKVLDTSSVSGGIQKGWIGKVTKEYFIQTKNVL